MLTLHTSDACGSRRDFLTAGALALGGLSLPSLFSVRGLKANSSSDRFDTGKSVIFVFQQGGPSQYETFDPKPDAPEGVRTVTGVIPTPIPGISFGDSLPRLASLAKKLTIVRSYATGNAAHNIEPLVGPNSLNASLSSLYTSVVGSNHPTTAMPTSAVLFPQAVNGNVPKGQARGDLSATGPFGASFAPFIPGGTGQLQKNLRLSLSPDRFTDRQQLLSHFNRFRDAHEAVFEQYDREQQQALDVLLSGSVANALDLSQEDPRVVAKYDTSGFAAKHNWTRAARGKRGYYTGHAKTFGKALLLARRLCEAGCGFVTVHTDYEGVWDMHADGNNLNMVDGMEAIGRSFDHAVAAFIEDVESRGLSEKILLIATGEMGRTPRINKNGGRDHWAKLTPLLLYGGGFAGGQVVGQSTRDGAEPNSDRIGTPQLISTILHTVFDMGQLRLKPELRTLSLLGEPDPIPGRI